MPTRVLTLSLVAGLGVAAHIGLLPKDYPCLRFAALHHALTAIQRPTDDSTPAAVEASPGRNVELGVDLKATRKNKRIELRVKARASN